MRGCFSAPPYVVKKPFPNKPTPKTFQLRIIRQFLRNRILQSSAVHCTQKSQEHHTLRTVPWKRCEKPWDSKQFQQKHIVCLLGYITFARWRYLILSVSLTVIIPGLPSDISNATAGPTYTDKGTNSIDQFNNIKINAISRPKWQLLKLLKRTAEFADSFSSGFPRQTPLLVRDQRSINLWLRNFKLNIVYFRRRLARQKRWQGSCINE